MKQLDKVFADFNNADKNRRIRLNTNGALEDIKTKKIKLHPGLQILLDDEDGLSINGIVQFSEEENIWVVEIDWDKLKSA